MLGCVPNDLALSSQHLVCSQGKGGRIATTNPETGSKLNIGMYGDHLRATYQPLGTFGVIVCWEVLTNDSVIVLIVSGFTVYLLLTNKLYGL